MRAPNIFRDSYNTSNALSSPSYAQPADAQPSRFAERRQLEEPRELVACLAEVHELTARLDRHPFAAREMVEHRLELDCLTDVAADENAFAKHAAPLVEVHERQLREPVDFRQCFAKRLNGGVRAGGDGQRVGERGKRARRHRLAAWRTAERARREEGLEAKCEPVARAMSIAFINGGHLVGVACNVA